ncbi:MAG: hypothetical protein U0Y68_20990 [Blastocatellia bacterium]
MPLGIVATDLQAGKMVVFTEGDIPLAVRAMLCDSVLFHSRHG